MTVRELINILMHQDGDLEVYVEGYEDGYNDITKDKIKSIEVCKNFYSEENGGYWWNGDHEDYNVVRKGPADLNNFEIKKGIVFTS